jgi:hypothetical protein
VKTRNGWRLGKSQELISQMKREIERELLDELPADDPRAIRSRRDLRRVHRWMSDLWPAREDWRLVE